MRHIDQRVLNGNAVEIVADVQDGKECAAVIGDGVSYVYPDHEPWRGMSRLNQRISTVIPNAHIEISRLQRIV